VNKKNERLRQQHATARNAGLLAPFDACAPSKVLMIPLHWHHQQTGNPADRSKTTSPAVV